MTRRNLIVARVGANSLHPRWIDRPYAERDFDLLLSFYSKDAHAAFTPSEGVSAVLVEGGKWDGLFKTLSGLDLEGYDRVWLPDDDIDTTTQDINRMLAICETYCLAVAQPALSRDSYYSHFFFSRCPSLRLRYTNYVEIMVPCLSTELLKHALPYFKDTMSGFGLDYIWCRWQEAGAFRVAIIDEVEVRHTRPVGKVLNAAMVKKGGLDAKGEEMRLKAQLGVNGRTVPIAFAGIRTNGQPVSGRVAIAAVMLRDWVSDRKAFRDIRMADKGMVKVARRQLMKKLDLRVH